MSLLRTCITTSRSLFANSIRYSSNKQAPSLVAPIIPDYTSTVFNQTSASAEINGIRVSTLSSNSASASVTLNVNTGSRFESEDTNGANHFLQHLIFTNNKSQSGESPSQRFEKLGAVVNVNATRENVSYTVSCLPKDVESVLQILGDMSSSISDVSKTQVDNIRHRVISHKLAAEKCKHNRAMDHLHSIIYQQDSFGFTKEGRIDVLEKINAKTLSQIGSEYYQNNNYSIGVSGNFSKEKVHDAIGKIFSQKNNKSRASQSSPKFYGSVVTERDDTNDSVLFTLGYDGVSKSHENYYPLALAKELLGDYCKYSGGANNHSSRLAEFVATENLCDSFSTFNLNYSDSGVFGITTNSYGKCLDYLVGEICSELVRLGHNARPGEFERAKSKLINKILSADEGSDNVSYRLALFAQLGLSPPTLRDEIESISEITIDRFRDACSEHFMDTEPAIVGIGSTRRVPDYNQVRGWTHWWRF